jgi:hypothetical protein
MAEPTISVTLMKDSPVFPELSWGELGPKAGAASHELSARADCYCDRLGGHDWYMWLLGMAASGFLWP